MTYICDHCLDKHYTNTPRNIEKAVMKCSVCYRMKVCSPFHEHELKAETNPKEYETTVEEAIRNLCIPGFLHAYHLKGFT